MCPLAGNSRLNSVCFYNSWSYVYRLNKKGFSDSVIWLMVVCPSTDLRGLEYECCLATFRVSSRWTLADFGAIVVILPMQCPHISTPQCKLGYFFGIFRVDKCRELSYIGWRKGLSRYVLTSGALPFRAKSHKALCVVGNLRGLQSNCLHKRLGELCPLAETWRTWNVLQKSCHYLSAALKKEGLGLRCEYSWTNALLMTGEDLCQNACI